MRGKALASYRDENTIHTCKDIAVLHCDTHVTTTLGADEVKDYDDERGILRVSEDAL